MTNPTYVHYDAHVESINPGEQETFQKIVDVMLKGQHEVRERVGESVRISHAKAHGFLRGELIVEGGLPVELAQGLFAKPGTHPVLVRLSQAPGEMLDDRQVSSPRGMAIKVFEVEGAKIPEHNGSDTQDFVLGTGKVFIAGTATTFLANLTPAALVAPVLPEPVKGAVSKGAQAVNAALHAVGTDSATLDFYGHPRFHPLAEAYFTQAALRYGEYVAKLSVTPANPALVALLEKTLDLKGENALRETVVDYFRKNSAEYNVNVQLCTDLETMPVEDPTVEWPEERSPYRKVARLVLPAQNAFDDALQDRVDHDVSFAPIHSLAAHRPLGSVMRARLYTYPRVAAKRRHENGRPAREFTRIDQIMGASTDTQSLAMSPASVEPRMARDPSRSGMVLSQQSAKKLGRAMGWFSIGLGLTELLAADSLSRWLGVEKHKGLIQAFGVREIGAGVGILLSDGPPPGWLWNRVAGDVMDLAALGAAFSDPQANRAGLGVALAAVAGATAADIVCATSLDAHEDDHDAQLQPGSVRRS